MTVQSDPEQQARDEQRHDDRLASVQFVIVGWGFLGYAGTLSEAREVVRESGGTIFVRHMGVPAVSGVHDVTDRRGSGRGAEGAEG